MRIDLHYGAGSVAMEIPEGNLGEVIRPWADDSRGENAAFVRDALGTRAANEFARCAARKRMCVLVGDASRDMPIGDILKPLLKLMVDCAGVTFLICTGTHDSDTPGNRAICDKITSCAKAAGIDNFDIHIHDCRQDNLVDAGKTSRGTSVLYNPVLRDADIFCVLSDVKFHYFAGYSNPIKNFVPGAAAYITAEGNHSLALDERSTYGVHPWNADKARRDNPLACDQLEAMSLIVGARPVWGFVTISTSGKIQWATFGDAAEVSGQAFAASDERNTHKVTPTDKLIVSPGGLPNDVDLYISQRALELTQQAVLDGGEVLFVSACPDGIGHERTMANFYDRLTLSLDEIFDSISDEYKLFSHKPYKFALMIRRLRRIWVYSEIEDDLLTAAHLYPTHDVQAVIDGWIADDAGTKITVVDGANKLALYSLQGA